MYVSLYLRWNYYRFGPLVRHWTMRCEEFKKLAQNIGNYINISWTLALWRSKYKCMNILTLTEPCVSHIGLSIDVSGPGGEDCPFFAADCHSCLCRLVHIPSPVPKFNYALLSQMHCYAFSCSHLECSLFPERSGDGSKIQCRWVLLQGRSGNWVKRGLVYIIQN